jgi:hypothetical protein
MKVTNKKVVLDEVFFGLFVDRLLPTERQFIVTRIPNIDRRQPRTAFAFVTVVKMNFKNKLKNE